MNPILNKMEENDFGGLTQAKETPVTTPATEITKIMSNELLKVFELQECCKFIHSDFKKYYTNVQSLTSAKNENAKVVSEYKNRNKINATNSESLLQALNQLYDYKCELKSSYLVAQKALKSKKRKYKKVISSYDSAWNKALEEYTTDPVFVELQEIEQGNALLEREIERQEKLKTCTEVHFVQLKQNSEKSLLEKTVEFSKAVVQYNQWLKSTKRNKEEEPQQDTKGIFGFAILKSQISPFSRKEPFSPSNSDDANNPCSIDVSVFDDIMVPSENLENHNLEDDANSLDGRQFSTVLKNHEELDCSNNYQQTALLKNKPQVQGSNEGSLQDATKAVNENESQYFRTRVLESSRRIPGENVQSVEEWNRNSKSTNKPKNNNDGSPEQLKAVSSTSQQIESEEEVSKDFQMESEEAVSETSYEKQFGNHRGENYECQYQKTSSVSSDDLPAENLNENQGPSVAFYDQHTGFKPGCQIKESDKSFTGFFTLGSDQDASKPSIFKLF